MASIVSLGCWLWNCQPFALCWVLAHLWVLHQSTGTKIKLMALCGPGLELQVQVWEVKKNKLLSACRISEQQHTIDPLSLVEPKIQLCDFIENLSGSQFDLLHNAQNQEPSKLVIWNWSPLTLEPGKASLSGLSGSWQRQSRANGQLKGEKSPFALPVRSYAVPLPTNLP